MTQACAAADRTCESAVYPEAPHTFHADRRLTVRATAKPRPSTAGKQPRENVVVHEANMVVPRRNESGGDRRQHECELWMRRRSLRPQRGTLPQSAPTMTLDRTVGRRSMVAQWATPARRHQTQTTPLMIQADA